MAKGLGVAPLGVAPYGIGTPTAAPATGGTSQSSRKIDPVTGQYAFDANGGIAGMTNAQQLALLALRTVKDSSALEGFGLTESGGVLDAGFVQRRVDEIRSAFADLVRRGVLTLLSVDVDASTRPVRTVIRFVDLETKQERSLGL